MTRHCNSTLVAAALLLAIAGSAAGQDKVVCQGLDAVFARRARLAPKKMDGFVKDGRCQTERLVFHDTETGAEVWRLTFDPSMNCIHSHINRSPWNCDGSMLVFLSDRGMPKIWKRKETGRGDPHFFLTAPDGSSFQMMRPRVPEGKWGTYLSGRHVVWDRFDPKRTYWVTYPSLYAVDVAPDGLKPIKLAPLPSPERRKCIFSYPSENNVLMIKDLNSRSYEGQLYFVDLRKQPGEEGFSFHYSWQFKVDHPKHKPETEFGFHEVYFRRTPDDSYVFNFGSSGSSGEPLFFEAPLQRDPKKIRICYPDDALKIPYYSHPAWSHDGRLVSYFGCEEPGPAELNPGWHVRDHDARKDVARLIPGWVGGHIAWDGYDENWVFAAISSKRFKPEWHGWIVHAYIPDGKARKLVRHYTKLNGGKSNYAAIARPAQSPDGTKCLYHSTMLHTDDVTMDLYVAVSHRPAPPTALRAVYRENCVELTWKPPRMHREIKGYRVYRREDSQKEFGEPSEELVTEPSFRDATAKAGVTYQYFVTGEEHSGLESEVSSQVAGPRESEMLPGLKGWDKTPPAPVPELTCVSLESGMARLEWQPCKSPDVRYYSIYYSDAGRPKVAQTHRVVSPGKRDASYLDWGLDPTREQHFYAITAVDRQGNESAPTFAQTK